MQFKKNQFTKQKVIKLKKKKVNSAVIRKIFYN